MADSKISSLTEDTTPTFDDLVVTVNDPAGTPASKKAKLVNVAGAPVNAQTGTSYTILTTDFRKLITHTNGSAIAVTLPQAGASFPANWFCIVQNRGAGAVTITPTTSTIDGAATLVLNTNEGAIIFSDGTNYFTFRGKTLVGAGGGAPADATYIVQTANGSLSAEQALGALATGLVKNTTTTGVLSIATATDISSPVAAADAGANDTYTATLSPAPASYVDGVHYRFKANTANTGAATINFNALGAKTIKKVVGGVTTDLSDNDIRAGQWVDLVYDGTNMQMQSTLGNAQGGAPSGSAGGALGGTYPNPTVKVSICIAVSDETTSITTGTAKVTFRMPHAMTLTEVRASLSTASSSGNPAIDINESGSTILSTTITIDSGEKTSTTAATPPVISDSALADDAEITIDIDTAGTGAKGLKVYLIGTRT